MNGGVAALIGFSPLPGSLEAAPIAISCGWTEVSLSLRMIVAINGTTIYNCMEKSLALRHPLHQRILEKEQAKWSWRTCNLAYLYIGVRGMYRIRTYEIFKGQGGQRNFPSTIHFIFQAKSDSLTINLYANISFAFCDNPYQIPA
jgi:hypothetical protein